MYYSLRDKIIEAIQKGTITRSRSTWKTLKGFAWTKKNRITPNAPPMKGTIAPDIIAHVFFIKIIMNTPSKRYTTPNNDAAMTWPWCWYTVSWVRCVQPDIIRSMPAVKDSRCCSSIVHLKIFWWYWYNYILLVQNNNCKNKFGCTFFIKISCHAYTIEDVIMSWK